MGRRRLHRHGHRSDALDRAWSANGVAVPRRYPGLDDSGACGNRGTRIARCRSPGTCFDRRRAGRNGRHRADLRRRPARTRRDRRRPPPPVGELWVCSGRPNRSTATANNPASGPRGIWKCSERCRPGTPRRHQPANTCSKSGPNPSRYRAWFARHSTRVGVLLRTDSPYRLPTSRPVDVPRARSVGGTRRLLGRRPLAWNDDRRTRPRPDRQLDRSKFPEPSRAPSEPSGLRCPRDDDAHGTGPSLPAPSGRCA